MGLTMKCGHCGSEVEDGFTVCTGCGANYRPNYAAFSFGLLIAGSAVASLMIPHGNWKSAIGALVGIVIGGFFMSMIRHKGWYRQNS